MNDPRVEAAHKAYDWSGANFAAILSAADAADREAGIHRVRVDDAAVERVARVMWRSQGHPDSMITGRKLERFEDAARAVLAALTGAGS